jgi:rod shape-determining protein MreB
MDILIPTRKYYDKIAEIILEVLIKLPPEVSAEIRNSGLYFSGLASTVYGLEQYYSNKFNIKIHVSKSAGMTVCLGGGTVIADKELLKKVAFKIN